MADLEDEYDYYQPEQLQASRGAFERTQRDVKREDITFDLRNLHKRKDILGSPPDERLYLIVKMIANRYENEFNFSEKDIEFLLENTNKIPNPEYKNPSAYILGYYIVDRGKINKKKLNRAIQLSQQLDIVNVNDKDILRYAKLWKK